MVEFQGSVAGEYGVAPFTLTVLLYEGDITKVENPEGPAGFTLSYITTRSDGISDADVRDGKAWVELYDDEAITYLAAGGIPVMRKAATAQNGYVGRVVKIEGAKNKPTDTNPVTALADQLSGNLLRVAEVELVGIQGAIQAECKIAANGGGADSINIGTPANVAWDVSEKKWVYVGSGGTTMIPFHHLEGSTTTDVTGHVLMGIGLMPVKVQA